MMVIIQPLQMQSVSCNFEQQKTEILPVQFVKCGIGCFLSVFHHFEFSVFEFWTLHHTKQDIWEADGFFSPFLEKVIERNNWSFYFICLFIQGRVENKQHFTTRITVVKLHALHTFMNRSVYRHREGKKLENIHI